MTEMTHLIKPAGSVYASVVFFFLYFLFLFESLTPNKVIERPQPTRGATSRLETSKTRDFHF